jgi:hypothetical protein
MSKPIWAKVSLFIIACIQELIHLSLDLVVH